MRFGSQKTLQLIEYNLLVKGNQHALTELYSIISEDAMSRLSRYSISSYDKEDIVQDVCLKFFKSSSKHFDKLKNCNEAERNAWLNTVVDNTFYDLCRRNKGEVIEEESVLNFLNQIEQYNYSDKHEQVVDWLFMKLKKLILVDTDIQNILAFLESRVISGLDTGSSKGKPRKIAEEFNGKPLREVFEMIVKDIEETIGESIPDDIICEMMNKLQKSDKQNFYMRAREISDKCNWLDKRTNISLAEIMAKY